MSQAYKNKVVLITGGGSGLGQALALEFARNGAKVAITDISEKGIQETASLLKSEGYGCLGFIGDVTKLERCQEIATSVIQTCGGIDVLVNNAGITLIKPFAPEDMERFYRVMNINFTGAVHMWSVCSEAINRSGGQVIVISSVAGFAPLYGRTSYAASKHALHGFFETLRTEVAQFGVSVLMVCPSFISTRIRENALDGLGSSGEGSTGEVIPPSEVAKKILLAASRRQRLLITGKTGILSYLAWKFFPKFYEHQMMKRMRESWMD